jgi:indole-3-glycerol phosphate synthase
MPDFLAMVAGDLRSEIERRRKQLPPEALRDRPLFHAATRRFAQSVRGPGRRIIAEVKRASPSKGVIREVFEPVAIAMDYANHGASAISVLTEERFFHGRLEYLESIRAAVPVPLLRKDFIIDPYQLMEAKSFGADAVLLIAALLDTGFMRGLREEADALSLDTLFEVHSENELEAALAAGAQLIGINNRDLRTFEVNLATTKKLARLVPSEIPLICESGIDDLAQIRQAESWGVHSFLIGESLMRAPEPGMKLKELLAG